MSKISIKQLQNEVIERFNSSLSMDKTDDVQISLADIRTSSGVNPTLEQVNDNKIIFIEEADEIVGLALITSIEDENTIDIKQTIFGEEFTLEVPTDTELGGILIGDGLTIDDDGKVSVDVNHMQNKLVAGAGITINDNEISVDPNSLSSELNLIEIFTGSVGVDGTEYTLTEDISNYKMILIEHEPYIEGGN